MADPRRPAAQNLNGWLLVAPELVAEVRNALVRQAQDRLRRDGVRPPPAVRELIDVAFSAASTAVDVHELLASTPVVPDGDVVDGEVEMIGRAEAAEILGCSPRHVVRVRGLSAQRVGDGRRLYVRAEVEALAAQRRPA